MSEKPEIPLPYWKTVSLRLILVTLTLGLVGSITGLWQETHKDGLIAGTLITVIVALMFVLTLFCPMTKEEGE